LSTLISSRDEDGSSLSHRELVGVASILLVAGDVPPLMLCINWFPY